MFTSAFAGLHKQFFSTFLIQRKFFYYLDAFTSGLRKKCKMSLKRRRWSNELVDSLVDFQARESTQPIDLLEVEKKKSNDSLDACSAEMLMMSKLNLEENTKIAEDNNSDRSQSSHETLSTSIKEYHTVCRKNSSTTPIRPKNVDISSTSLDANKQSFDFNERLSDNDTGSSERTVKLSSCNLDNLNERIEMHTTSDSGTVKASSCNSTFIDSKEINLIDQSIYEKRSNVNEESFKQRFFSSPVVANKDADFISDIDEPDVWETLVALERILSPFEDQLPSSEEKYQDPPHILSRLSQKFKETPTQFTEKLVSIIEDSVVSLESPTKTADNSGISLHRMTGEFRKLCKFIEDESMPDWAPSLINMTEIDQGLTPPEKRNNENNTPKALVNETKNANSSSVFRFTPKGSRFFTTPKKSTQSNNQTPIRNFTPSADKSFEYWEEVCNIMYENQNSAKKNSIKRFSILKSVKSNMDDLLTRCERQLASLDETQDIRCSEPCRKPVNDLKVSAVTPRSKSVSNLFLNGKENEKESSVQKNVEETIGTKNKTNITSDLTIKIDHPEVKKTLKTEDELIKSKKQNLEVVQLDNDLEIAAEVKEGDISNDEDDYVLSTNKVFRRNPDFSMENCNTSLYSPATMQVEYNSYMLDESDADCSLLKELAKRRQRCLDTAKLMMEIDREDPMTTNDDTKCVETLYKLGIQDKTYVDVQKDVKFVNTLNHCFEYKKYLSDKSKPFVNMLSTIDSPEILKSRTSSKPKCKDMLSRPQSRNKADSKVSVNKKAALESKRTLKSVQSRIATPRLVSATLAKTSTAQSERKISQVNNLQPVMRRVSNRKLSSTEVCTPRLMRRPSPTVNSYSQVRRTPSVGAVKVAAPSNKANLLLHPKKLGTAHKSFAKTSPNRDVSKPMLEGKAQTLVKASLRKTPSMETPKFLRKGTAIKPPFKSSSSKQQAARKLQCDRLTPEITKSKERILTSVCTPSGQGNSTEKSVQRAVSVTPENVAEIFSAISPTHRKMPKQEKLFLTPGKSPSLAVLGRKKPMTYFSDIASKKMAPQKITYDNVKSPIGMYVHSTDTELIQNIQGQINDRLLTPVRNVSSREGSLTPKLKFHLSSKENQSPTIISNGSMVLPPVKYEPAKKVCLTEGKSPFANANTPNSKTRKLLEPVENTVVIRHEGRVIQYNPNPNGSTAEMSIRVQKVADKGSSLKKKLL